MFSPGHSHCNGSPPIKPILLPPLLTNPSLNSVRTLRTPLPPNVAKENYSHQSKIIDCFATVVSDLQGINAWRYQRQISPGIQEYVEAMSFQHYLRHQTLITFDQAQHQIAPGISLVEHDYLLGLFDLVGELMRFAITSMATHGTLPRGPEPSSEQDDGGGGQEEEEGGGGGGGRDILTDLRVLRSCFESLDTTSSGKEWTPLKRDVGKKMEVMRSCVEKVEGAMYGMIVRGRERPKGWVPDLGGGEGREVESY